MFCLFFLGLFVTKQNCFDALYWILLANLRYPSKSSCSSWVCKYESLHPIGSGGAYVSDGKSSDGEIPNVNPGSITPNWSPGGVHQQSQGFIEFIGWYSAIFPYVIPIQFSCGSISMSVGFSSHDPGFSSHFSHDFPTISGQFSHEFPRFFLGFPWFF